MVLEVRQHVSFGGVVLASKQSHDVQPVQLPCLYSKSSLVYNKAVPGWDGVRDATAFTSQVGLWWKRPTVNTESTNCGCAGAQG